MLKEEFEKLAMRGHGTITVNLYEAIERYYISESYYHQHGLPEMLTVTMSPPSFAHAAR